MKDEDLEKLLRALPRQKASGDFTSRVLSRLEEREDSSPPGWARLTPRPLLAGAAALLLLGAMATGLQQVYQLRERHEAARRVERLRSEYEALENELEALRSMAADAQPVLELGGTEEVDILLDLRTLARGAGPDSQAQPVDYRR